MHINISPNANKLKQSIWVNMTNTQPQANKTKHQPFHIIHLSDNYIKLVVLKIAYFRYEDLYFDWLQASVPMTPTSEATYGDVTQTCHGF